MRRNNSVEEKVLGEKRQAMERKSDKVFSVSASMLFISE